MGLFGFVGSVVKGVAKGAACVAAVPVTGALLATYGAVTVAEKAAPVVGKVAKGATKATFNALAEANEVRKNSAGMSDAELRNAYNSTTSATKRVGYAAAMKERYES